MHFKTLIHVTSKIKYGCQPHNSNSQIGEAMRYQWTIILACDLEYAVAQLVEALCYKPEGCGLNSRWYWNFSLT
jgi:hypothetical protein